MSKYEIKKEDVYGIEPNIPVVHQVGNCQDASARQGNHFGQSNRHEVSGGGVKPTVRRVPVARQGSIRAGQWTGGMSSLTYPHTHVVNKMVKLAMRSGPSARLQTPSLSSLTLLSLLSTFHSSRQRLHSEPRY